MGWVLLIFLFGILLIILIYTAEPAGPFIQLCQMAWVASVKLCLQGADLVEKMGDNLFRSWHMQPKHQWPHIAQPPRYLVYAVKSSKFGANLLRYLGNLLARGAISYRNRGPGFVIWPARFVVTARGLFLHDSISKLSFTPTWDV